MSFSRDEIMESLAEDISSRPVASFRMVPKTKEGKFAGYAVIRRKGRGLPDYTPEWRTRGRSTLERIKLNKRRSIAKVPSDFLLWVA
jgi:hypothetical protein